MPNSEDDKSAVKELLLEEYRNFSESFWKNEQTGETRVNWFIGIVSGASAGLIGLATAERRPHGEQLRLILVAALFALIAFGIVTLLRIKKRNETTDGYKKDTKRVRDLFKDHFDKNLNILSNYHPLKGTGERRKFGGLLDIVLTINSLLVAAFAAAIVYPFGSQAPQRGPTYAAAIIAFLVSFLGQRAWAVQKGPTHAGGIVYQVTGDKVEYCLVGPSKHKANPEWLFPKGHIEGGEEPWETALREVREESGVVGRLISPVGSSKYELPTGKVFVKYYLMEAVSDSSGPEDRSRAWFEFEAALGELTHPANKTLLSEAEKRRQEIDRKIKSGTV